MGYIKHNAAIITSTRESDIELAHAKAKELYTEGEMAQLVGEIIPGLVNGQYSFFIAPDGSKEGWDHSDTHDAVRNKYLDWLFQERVERIRVDYVDVRFGGDDEGGDYVSRSWHMDLDRVE
jgi:hypothetical protein